MEEREGRQEKKIKTKIKTAENKNKNTSHDNTGVGYGDYWIEYGFNFYSWGQGDMGDQYHGQYFGSAGFTEYFSRGFVCFGEMEYPVASMFFVSYFLFG